MRLRSSIFLVSLLATAPLVPSLAAASPPRVLANYPIATGIPQPPLSYLPDMGPALAAVGDIDGNGTTDLAVGAAGDNEGGPERGAVIILFMDEVGNVTTTKRITSTDAALAGLSDGDQFGTSLAAIGDVNDDDIPDLAVGAAGDDDGALDAGAVWIVTMTSTGAAGSAHKISAKSAGAGVAAIYDAFGSAVTSLGDVDGNGTVDVAIGAVGSDRVQFNSGAVWICLLEADFTVKAIRRLGDDASGFDSELVTRGGLGLTLTTIGTELFVGALGDGTATAPEAVLWAFAIDSQGAVASYRQVLPASAVPLPPNGAVATFGDFDFDGIDDLLANVDDGLRILFLDEEGQVTGSRQAGGQWPDQVRCCGYRANLLVLPDLDGNLVPEVVSSGPGFFAGEVWMLRLNGMSQDGASCGDPTGDGVATAGDALYVLRAAVGLRFCELLWCDVDESDRITANDALAVLRRAIQSAGLLACPTTSTSTSTTYIYYDECFEDADCSWDPEQPHCCAYECCQCDYDVDCEEGAVCDGEVCRPATCFDTLMNGDETGPDCGGSCRVCIDGAACSANADCVNHVCAAGQCQSPTCEDSAANGSETGIDCGGGECAACEPYQGCQDSSDCTSRVCRWFGCDAPTCEDRVRNADETANDCGGGTCPPCGTGKSCQVDADCTSSVCLGSACQVATCSDLVQNGTETGIDCGGATCGACH